MNRFLIGVIILLGAITLATHTLSAQGQSKQTSTVSVNGSAQIKATPDEIYISIKLNESDTKGKVTLEEQRRNMFAALKKGGVDAEKQLSVVDMSSSYFRRRNSLAATQYELKVGSAEAVRRVFEALDDAQISNVSISRTACSNLEELRSDARRAAMQNARQRARELAEAVGQSIGPCLEINDYTTSVQPIATRGKMMLANAAMTDEMVLESEPNVEFEQIVINYNISAKFLLKLE